jgi:polysaccharide export outer membrane protein
MKRLFLFFSLFFFISSLILTNRINAQQQEAIKEQVETQFQKYTPEQIKEKIKELGLTEQEFQQRAKALGLDAQQYFDILSGKPVEQTEDTTAAQWEDQRGIKYSKRDTLSKHFEDSLRLAERLEERMLLDSIPGFYGRADAKGLRPFGYNLFQSAASTFEPMRNAPTSPSYVIGPGDELLLTMWGEAQLFTRLIVNREGNIVIPNAGPVPVQGLTIETSKARLLKRLTSFYSGLRNGGTDANTWLDVSIGKLRTIQVFVLGEVKKPGGYAISSMSTSFLALYVAGGPTINGSLRSIEVMRNNKCISTIDFYDYILRGDKSKDVWLQDGDIVFVKPTQKKVAIAGFVLRPAIYELKESETLGDMLKIAGGLRFDAYIDRIHIERIVPFEERKNYTNNYLDYDLRFSTYTKLETSNFMIKNGDIVKVFQVGSVPENRITITGNVKKSGVFELKPGMRVKDLIMEADSLDRNTFSERGTIFRLLSNLRREIIPFSPRLALLEEINNNIELKNEDSLVIYKESQFFPPHTVSVGGAVRNPGTYPRHDNMTVADLVVMAGGLTEYASKTYWELARVDTSTLGRLSKVFQFDVQDSYWNNQLGNNGLLQDYDHLMVPVDAKFNSMRVVVITGYTLFPGSYALQYEGEKLSSIINRAGGLRPGAYLEGSTLFRKWNNAGLVPIDFEKAIADGKSLDNISLLANDSITIAFKQEVVLVRGEVFVPSAVVHKAGGSLGYYLNQAGGLKDEADDGRIYVTLPNGRKWERGWFLLPDPDIPGGSVILVPKKVEKENTTLPVLRDWATIFVSIATMMVAIVQVTK